MFDTNKKTFQTHPSLLPLRMTLTAAQRESPAYPPRIDPDERLALQLIYRMKTEYAKPLPFRSWKDNTSFHGSRLQEVIGTNA